MSADQGGQGPITPPPRGSGGAPSGAELAGVGIQFVAAILVFLFLGQWLDRRLGTDPWLMIVGVFLGAGGGFYSMYRKLMDVQRREEEHRKGQRR
jgi:ATP synthase protein I